MTEIQTLYFAGRDWTWVAAAVFVASVGIVAWSYTRSPGSRGLRISCACLKLLGTAALLLCLLEPIWTGQRAKQGANLFAIVADNSLSMKLHGRGERESRGEALARTLAGEDSAWRQKLAEDFEVRSFIADTRLLPTTDFRELAFSGESSALGGGMKTLVERYRGQPLAGVLLFTDGVIPDLSEADFAGLPPIYPVIFGNELPPRDLAIASTSVTQTSFEDAPVTIQANVTAIGCAGETIIARLIPISAEADGKPVKPATEETQKVPARDDARVTFRFQLRPEKQGVLFYRVQVAAKQNASDEATLANNETVVTIDRGSEPHRILYVSGRPNWEYKFLQRAIVGDDQTQLAGLIRIAKREPKFEFKGRTGESSNPLFRGFGNQSKEEIERYDQPVLVRLNTLDEFELRDGFPKTPEDLFRYKAIILDDLEAEFFTADQMSLIQKFVSERGGGFLMLGGAESFANGRYQRTAIGDLLPVYVDGKTGDRPAELRLQLTREGWLQPWARLRRSEAEENARLAELPAMEILNATGSVKPSANIIATVSDGQRVLPALVTQRFGRGRSAALLIGDFYQSGMGSEDRQKDLAKAWRQMIRWLVSDVPGRIELRAEPEADALSVKLAVRARDEKFQPIDNASVSLKVVQAEGGDPISLTAEPSLTEAGVYEASYIPRQSGGYRVEASIQGEDGVNLGATATGWTTDLAASEFQSLSPNRALMELLAQKTGGSLVKPGDVAAFVRDLPSRRAPVTEVWTRPLWHTPWVLLFALGCFVGEWGLRRMNGLA